MLDRWRDTFECFLRACISLQKRNLGFGEKAGGTGGGKMEGFLSEGGMVGWR